MKARENPFRSERIEGLRFRHGGLSVEGLADRAIGLGACAIVGPEGSGKTTLLESLAASLEARGFGVRLRRVGPKNAASVPEGTSFGDGRRALLLDGLESAGSRARYLIRNYGTGWDLLIISAHRSGILPSLVELNPSPGLLVDLVRDLLGIEAAAGLEPALPGLFKRHGGNLRECFRELYDRAGD